MSSGRSFRVLFTNNTLAYRAGSELFVFDLAVALRKRGHQPIAFSTVLGEVADQLRSVAVPVIDDLGALTVTPDIIHGQHHLELATALLRFPNTPAIHVCHGWLPWEEEPLRFPTIQKYIAVSNLTRERLLTSGIPMSSIEIVHNFVDTERFRPRGRLASGSTTAAVFSNYLSREHPHFLEILSACRQLQVERIDLFGSMAASALSKPEEVLPGYDVIFCAGRCALEALACGCAVIVVDHHGFAGLVTPANLAYFRSGNFGIDTTYGNRVTAADVVAEMAKIVPSEVEIVSRMVRAEANLSSIAATWERIYIDAMCSFEASSRLDRVTSAGSDYLRALNPVIKNRHAEWISLLSKRAEDTHRIAGLEGSLAEARSKITALGTAIDNQTALLSETQTKVGNLEAAAAAAKDKVAQLHRTLDERTRELARAREGTAAIESTLAQRDRDLAILRIVAIKKSLSWRLTAPFREVYRPFRRLHETRFGVRLRAACRHPANSRERKAFRANRMGEYAAAHPHRPHRPPKCAAKVRALVRHPFSSKLRKAYRERLRETPPHPRAALTSPDVASTDAIAIGRAEAPDRRTALHATIFERWVANSLGEYPATDFISLARTPPPVEQTDVKLVAYYLPQYHPIPENDKWWGKGFTEWRNVVRAHPQFQGHYQPRVPGELGYYDLRVVDVMRRQVGLAHLYGINAFCFHFYWFGGKTLLEAPIENYLKCKDLNLPFCLCWANENWSRRWDGSENEILIAQQHSPEDDVAFLRYIDKYFRDERYLKIGGRPLLTVYRPSLFPDPVGTVKRWRDLAGELGYPDLYLIATNSFGFRDYKSLGFDALSEFPPHHVEAKNIQDKFELSKFRTGWRIRSYEEIVESERSRVVEPGTVHPGIMVSWDNSARRPANGEIIHGSTPALFKRWPKHCFSRVQSNTFAERLIFINAWNEWAEGTYLEPDSRFGYAYLNACREVVREYAHRLRGSVRVLPGIPEWFPKAKTVLLCSHHAGTQVFGGERSFVDVLRALNANDFNVVVTLQEGVNLDYIQKLRAYAQEVRIFPYRQWTRDSNGSLDSVPEFLAALKDVRADLVYVNTIMVAAPLAAARFHGIPAIVHTREIVSHDIELQNQIGAGGGDIVNQLGRAATHIIVNSQATLGCFATLPHISFIPNIVDVEELDIPNRDDGQTVRFGLISSNLPKKGIVDVIELARLSERVAPQALFIIIGPLKALAVQEYLEGKKAVPSNVEFVDYITSPADALNLVDVVLNFSHFQESFGRTVLEGLAAGRPAIVYKWGALPELVEHGVTGFAIPYREPEAALPHIRALCERPTLLRMREKARTQAKRSISRADFQRRIGGVVSKTIALGYRDRRSYSEVREERAATYTNEAIDIVICVHNALNEVGGCLRSVAKYIGCKHRLILIDDGSDEPTTRYLKEFTTGNSFATLHRNDVALGYTKAANMGARLSTGRLVILLNSDTIVTPFWAEKMADAVFSTHGAGIVGPLSNAASYQSLPGVTGTKTQTAVNGLPPNCSIGDMNTWCEERSPVNVPCVPLVHGFCFGITRDAWNVLGEFDEAAFPEGYGEENDYCFRAVNAGFGLVVATHTYVFHVKSKSYAEERRYVLAEKAQRILYDRYGRDRFLGAVKISAEQPVLQLLRGEAARLWTIE